MRASALLIAALLLPTAQALADDAQVSSVYTTFDTKHCKHKPGKPEEEDYGSWTCAGYDGQKVLLSAGDQRMYVSFGNGKGEADASGQTLEGFNDVYDGKVEWRLEKSPDGRLHPFATILRWNVVTAGDNEQATGAVTPGGRVLVVTRLGPGGVCHVGYVDARANPDANDLARKIADEHARDFKCGKDKRIVLGKVTPGLELPSDE